MFFYVEVITILKKLKLYLLNNLFKILYIKILVDIKICQKFIFILILNRILFLNFKPDIFVFFFHLCHLIFFCFFVFNFYFILPFSLLLLILIFIFFLFSPFFFYYFLYIYILFLYFFLFFLYFSSSFS